MFRFIGLCLGTLVRLLRARRGLLLENLALRQQLAVLKRRHPRPRLDLLDKLCWVAVRRFWSGWQQSLIAVTPETVVSWHKAGFRIYTRIPRGRSSGRFLAIEGEGRTWIGQPSRQGIALFSVRIESWRITGRGKDSFFIAVCESISVAALGIFQCISPSFKVGGGTIASWPSLGSSLISVSTFVVQQLRLTRSARGNRVVSPVTLLRAKLGHVGEQLTAETCSGPVRTVCV